MAKPQFTFKNYIKEVRKAWLLVAIFFIAGAAGGAFYAFTRPTTYLAFSKLSVYNKKLNTGSVTSPYAQISDLLMSDELIDHENLSEYSVSEKPFGVFEVAARDTDSQKAIDTTNTVMEKANDVIAKAFEDSEDYEVTILKRATETTPGLTLQNRLISSAISAVGLLALALVIVFIKFDYIAEK